MNPIDTRWPLVASLNNARGHVAHVGIPPFETGYPPAIMWGDRVYLRISDAGTGAYLETFCYLATVEVRTAERGRPS